MHKESFTTPIEQYIIDRVREMRIARNISQAELGEIINLSSGFIGDVENPKRRAKYNLNHINTIVEKFQCSFQDLFPEKPFISLDQSV